MRELDAMYSSIISLENLFTAWEEFLCGKRKRSVVTEFSIQLSQNIFRLHKELEHKTYAHGPYEAFGISDPKPRRIYKATVRDRLIHHAVYRILYPLFEKKFIYDSYSCRDRKGTHLAVRRLLHKYRRASRNGKRTCWVLKCDVKKFFASVDHDRLMHVLSKYNMDEDTTGLIRKIVGSFNSGVAHKGLPLGNLTSQLLVNIYMNEFDQFMKHTLKEKYYIRFADDFVVLNTDRKALEATLEKVEYFLLCELNLKLHPNKVSIKTFTSGIDFLGWVNFPDHRVLRTTTKRRMLKALAHDPRKSVLASYRGMLIHGNTHKLRSRIDSCISRN